jgi:hypothetical protein
VEWIGGLQRIPLDYVAQNGNSDDLSMMGYQVFMVVLPRLDGILTL